MGLKASLPPHTIVEICDAVRRGEPRKAIAIDLDVAESTVDHYTQHIGGTSSHKRNALRAEVMRRLEAGEHPEAIATATNITPALAWRIYRSAIAEEDARRGG